MKRLRKYFLLVFITIDGIIPNLLAQSETEMYTTFYNSIEPILLQLSKYPHGMIQWQDSRNQGLSWRDIPGANEFNCNYSTDTSVYLRALVLSGTCDSLFSQLTSLRTLKVLTESVDSITDISAVINCVIDTGDVELSEYGLLFDNQPQVDEHATRFAYAKPVQSQYHIRIDSLQAGVDYYVRAYGMTGDEKIIYGNVLDFTTIKISFHQVLNVSKDTVQLFYSVTGGSEEKFDEHGIFINTGSGSLPTSTKVPGISENGNLTTIAGSLSPGTDYYVQAYIRKGSTYYYSKEKKITTWSNYDDPVDNTPFTIAHWIEWNDPSTAGKISQDGTFGEYGRVKRLGDTDTLLLVYHGGPNNGDWINIYMRKSYNNGTTWSGQEILMNLADHPVEYWRFCTPEILVLQNGWVLIAYEANARPDENQSSVQILISKDSARTWEDPIIYKTGRSWEPAMVQLPHGEIELFFSSEASWWPDDPIYQNIQVIRSTDNGLSWSEPELVAYYPDKRDGMPVPLVLQGNKGVVFAIETVYSGTSPYIIHRDMDTLWTLTTSNFESSPYRWWVSGYSGHGGAPYILQLPTGETVISAHIYRGGDWHQNNYQQVMIGDNDAKNYEGLSTPWGTLPLGESAVNNSLFLKDDTTIVSISTRMFTNGSGGIYWLEGQIKEK